MCTYTVYVSIKTYLIPNPTLEKKENEVKVKKKKKERKKRRTLRFTSWRILKYTK